MAKKVLSLDGGGSWSILQAIALREIYKDTDVGTNCRNILNQFDVISANSGGSLMLAGMIEKADEDIDEVIKMFKNEELLQEIFSKLKAWERSIPEILARLAKVGPKYKAKRKIDGIKKALKNTGTLLMKDLRGQLSLHPQLVICGFDYDLSRAVFFKTELTATNYSLADVIDATSNAPVNYFNEPVKFEYDHNEVHQFWDGAVGGYNNPVLIGITETMRIFDSLPRTWEEIRVLSIGTGESQLPVTGFTDSSRAVRPELMKSLQKSSLSKDIKKMSTSILSEPPDAANFIAHMFLGGVESTSVNPHPNPCIIRMNALLQPVLKEGIWTFPEKLAPHEYEDFISLIGIGMDAIEKQEILKIETLGSWWTSDKVINQSIRYNGRTFENLIGYYSFSKAKSEWLLRCSDR